MDISFSECMAVKISSASDHNNITKHWPTTRGLQHGSSSMVRQWVTHYYRHVMSIIFTVRNMACPFTSDRLVTDRYWTGTGPLSLPSRTNQQAPANFNCLNNTTCKQPRCRLQNIGVIKMSSYFWRVSENYITGHC